MNLRSAVGRLLNQSLLGPDLNRFRLQPGSLLIIWYNKEDKVFCHLRDRVDKYPDKLYLRYLGDLIYARRNKRWKVTKTLACDKDRINIFLVDEKTYAYKHLLHTRKHIAVHYRNGKYFCELTI